MPLVLVTGISTSGKSTIAKELLAKGFEAYDTEHDGISAWHNKQTGERVAGFDEMPERTKEWLSQHQWLISKDWVIEMAAQSKNKLVFLCGGAANEPEIRELCDKVIWLKTNEATIRRRVNNPRDHDYGTRPHELAAAIEGNARKEADYTAYGATMIDATQPIEAVVEQVLTAAKSSS
ncbi:MAG TPA: shikimate kinase [Candidatus Saccharimonadales bacterium]|nr:shikimate kinase [Candidatus Saccharimonadales bacterium]